MDEVNLYEAKVLEVGFVVEDEREAVGVIP
jgi:hypothetical protein